MNKVNVYDDKKGRHQSFEASIEVECIGQLIGYGSNKEESVAELKRIVSAHIKELKDINFNDTIDS